MPDLTIAERILRGREAEVRFNDEHLNKVFDSLIEAEMAAIVSADKSNTDDILQSKMAIDVIVKVRKILKIQIEDAFLASQQQED